MNNNLNNYNNLTRNNNPYPSPQAPNTQNQYNQNQFVNTQYQTPTYQNQVNPYQTPNNLGQLNNNPIPNQIPNNQNASEQVTNNVAPQPNNITSPSDVNNNNLINELNVAGSYNNIEKQDITPTENKPKTKKTVTINKELKTLMIIVAILLVFISFMPIVFDFFRSLAS